MAIPLNKIKLELSNHLGVQLGLAFASIILLLGGLALLAWQALGKYQQEARSLVEDRLSCVIQITTVREAYLSVPVRLANGVATGRLAGSEGARSLARARQEAGRQWQIYRATYLLPEEAHWLQQAEAQLGALAPLADDLQAMMASHRAGDPLLETWLNDRYIHAAGPLEGTLTSLVKFQERTGRAMLQAMAHRQQRLDWAGGSCLLVACSLAGLLACRFSRDLGRHATALVGHLQDLAEGNLSAPPFQARDGQWNQMSQDLARVVGRLRHQAALLEALERQARTSDQAKSAFVANMSHELRTPLSAILGYAQLMAREPGRAAEDRRQLDHILRAGEHLLTLINDVLTLSRIEAGRLEFTPAPFEPEALAKDLKALFQLTARGRGLALDVAAEGFPDQVEGDLPKLRQVLANLLGNAVKFTDAGEVRLRGRWAQGRARFEVEDTGPGMTLEEQARLFQAFTQAEAGLAKGGTGLGLHITRSLVQIMGGAIDVVSAPGRGSRFGFEIPLPEPEVAATLYTASLARRLAGGQGQPRILVVDDRPENREVLGRALAMAGFRTALAEHGAQALEQWQALAPELILMDLRMPVMDGFEAIRLLREREVAGALPRTPVVAISASVYDVSEAALRARGFDGYLPKPVAEGPLFTLIAGLLDLRLEQAGPMPAPKEALGKAALDALDADWRRGFRDKVAMGDLEAAEHCLDSLDDPGLRETLRGHLQAYDLQVLLDHLG
jgi:signal transduction histidine kinase/DNA-binding response OmpR family regulator